MKEYTRHELSEAFGAMSDNEYSLLKKDIEVNGLSKEGRIIIVIGNEILDGYHRYRAVTELKEESLFPNDSLELEFKEFDGEDPRQYVIRQNFLRRNITNTNVRAAIVVESFEWLERGTNQHIEKNLDRPAGRSKFAYALTETQMVEYSGAGERTIRRLKKLFLEARDLHQKVKNQEIVPKSDPPKVYTPTSAETELKQRKADEEDMAKLEKEDPDLFIKVKTYKITLSDALKKHKENVQYKKDVEKWVKDNTLNYPEIAANLNSGAITLTEAKRLKREEKELNTKIVKWGIDNREALDLVIDVGNRKKTIADADKELTNRRVVAERLIGIGNTELASDLIAGKATMQDAETAILKFIPPAPEDPPEEEIVDTTPVEEEIEDNEPEEEFIEEQEPEEQEDTPDDTEEEPEQEPEQDPADDNQGMYEPDIDIYVEPEVEFANEMNQLQIDFVNESKYYSYKSVDEVFNKFSVLTRNTFDISSLSEDAQVIWNHVVLDYFREVLKKVRKNALTLENKENDESQNN